MSKQPFYTIENRRLPPPPENSPRIQIIGAGLAGSEAAFQLAERGYFVSLYEMRPNKMTEAHQTQHCAELVCSNTFKSKAPESAPGMLKSELQELGSLILSCGYQSQVPGGQALAVDREAFSNRVTETLENHPRIEIQRQEVHQPFETGITLIATGPLTAQGLSNWLIEHMDVDDLYFYDAIAPIVDATTIDMDHAFLANRYDKGEEKAYLNCPLNQEEYESFVQALLDAEKVPSKPFEKEKFYRGCQPIEAIAEGGRNSLRFGPMKPVGLTDPRTGEKPYAVLQLRPENQSKSAYNLVGFQTKLKYGEQKKVFQTIPALKKAEYFRLGSVHRNTYVCGPKVLRPDLSLKNHPQVYLAGQITGVEGYLESTASGLLASLFIDQRIRNQPITSPPINTALGALLRHVIASNPKNYQPSGIHFGLIEPLAFESVVGLKRAEARQAMASQAISNFKKWLN